MALDKIRTQHLTLSHLNDHSWHSASKMSKQCNSRGIWLELNLQTHELRRWRVSQSSINLRLRITTTAWNCKAASLPSSYSFDPWSSGPSEGPHDVIHKSPTTVDPPGLKSSTPSMTLWLPCPLTLKFTCAGIDRGRNGSNSTYNCLSRSFGQLGF